MAEAVRLTCCLSAFLPRTIWTRPLRDRPVSPAGLVCHLSCMPLPCLCLCLSPATLIISNQELLSIVSHEDHLCGCADLLSAILKVVVNIAPRYRSCCRRTVDGNICHCDYLPLVVVPACCLPFCSCPLGGLSLTKDHTRFGSAASSSTLCQGSLIL